MSRDIQQQSTEAESDSHELPTREQRLTPMESAYQEIAALLEDAPEALTQEIEKTRGIIAQMIERAQSVNLDAEDISEFQAAMEDIITQMKALAREVAKQLGQIEANKEMVKTGLLDAEDFADDSGALNEFRDKIYEVVSGVQTRMEHIFVEKRREETDKKYRRQLANEIKNSRLSGNDIEPITVPPLEPSEELTTKRQAFEKAKASGVSPEMLAKAKERLDALEKQEQNAWDGAHAGNAEDTALIERIRVALDRGELADVFAEKGFDRQKAVSLIADQIRDKAFSAEISDNVLKMLPREVMIALVYDMSDEEMWGRMRQLTNVISPKEQYGYQQREPEKKPVSYIYISTPFKDRSDRLRRDAQDALQTTVMYTSHQYSMTGMYDAWAKNPDDARARGNFVEALRGLESSVGVIQASQDPKERSGALPKTLHTDLKDILAYVENPNGGMSKPALLTDSNTFRTVENNLYSAKNGLERNIQTANFGATQVEDVYNKQQKEQEKKEQAERHLTAAVDEAIRVAKYEVASELQKDINSYALEKKFREMQLIAEQLVPFIDRAILSETAYGEEKKRPMFKKSVKVTPEQLSAIIQLNKGNRVDEVPYDVYQSNHDALHFSRERVDTVRTDLLQRSDRDVSGLIPLPRKLTELIPTQASVRSKAMGAIDPSRGGYWAPNDRKVAQEAVDARLADKMSELQSEVSQQIRATMEQFVSDLQAKRAEIASVVSSGQERINTHVAEHPDSILKGARVVDIVSSLDRHIERAQSVLKGL